MFVLSAMSVRAALSAALVDGLIGVLIGVLIGALPVCPALADPAPVRQNLAALHSVAVEWLSAQATHMPGTPSVHVSAPDARLNLAPCDAMEPFLPASARLPGKTTIGIRCVAPLVWTVYLPAQLGLMVDYVSSAGALAQGQKLTQADLVLQRGDLASLPAGVLTDTAQAVGRTVVLPLAAGIPLVRRVLRSQPVVQQGQPVRLVAAGSGFTISSEGRALSSGHEGDLIQARTAGGQLISGIAQADGALAVRY